MIRRMEQADCEQIHTLQQACLNEAWSLQAVAEEQQRPDARCLVACEQQQLIGYAGIRICGDEAELMDICVAENSRRAGIGRALMLELLSLCRVEGVHRMMLEVREGNADARALYARLGFEQDGLRKRYYRNPEENAVLMSRYEG